MKNLEVPNTKEESKKQISEIMAEFTKGFKFTADIKKAVAIFGSSLAFEKNSHYKEARYLAKLLVKEKFTVVTGGGQGIMEAANRGAFEAHGNSIGINIKLPKYQPQNNYVTKSIRFNYFFVRKTMFSLTCSVFVFLPGGFGTLDEFFEMANLAKTKKLKGSPVIVAVGKDYWQPLFDWLWKNVCQKHKAISKRDLKMFHLVDSAKEALEIIKKYTY